MNVGSLFSGIGGFDLGLERAGMRVVWQCESDDFCRRVLAKHWPDVPCFNDVRDLSSAAGTPEVDVLCGGFPCQDISYAGKGAGITGTRSGLWSEYARLVGDLEPRWVIVENVSALLGRGLDRVLADLASLGYDAEWDCIPASAVGAPHQRDRLWLVAYPKRDELRKQSDGLPEREGARIVGDDGAQGFVADTTSDGCGQGWSGGLAGSGKDGEGFETEELADADHERRERSRQTRDGRYGPSDGRGGRRVPNSDREQHKGSPHAFGRQGSAELWRTWATEPDVGRVANGVPARVDRLRSLGNALIPQIAQWIGERIMTYEAHHV